MKTALIPPIPELPTFGNGDFHLLLSHLFPRPAYTDHYLQQGVEGAFMTLDNGAHENKRGTNARKLLDRAHALGASEIVLPDELFEEQSTITGTTTALKYIVSEGEQDYKLGNYGLMMVPQGRDWKSYRTCLQALIWMYEKTMREYPWLPRPVIGISKDYDEIVNGGMISILEHVMPMGYEVHLLGWIRNLWLLREAADRWPMIRSVDSAKPFVYAIHHIVLDGKKVPEYPKRSANYFDITLNDHQRDIAKWNVKEFRDIVS